MATKKDASINKARLMAVEIVYEIIEKGAYANLTLAKALRNSELSAADRQLLTEVVNGTVRMIKHLDWVLELFLHSPLKKQNPYLLNILRVALYQLLFLDKVPDYALVNDAVAMIRNKLGNKMSGLGNAVLRNIIRNRDRIQYPEGLINFYSVYHSHPEWLVEKWLDTFGAEVCEGLLSYNNRPGRMVLRCNLLKCNRVELLDKLGDLGVKAKPSPLTPWGIVVEGSPQPISENDFFRKGYFYIQNEASMLAAAILDPAAGERVLDLCCGVGGKTTHLAEYMCNQGEILAIDLYPKKLALLRQNCQRLELDIVKTLGINVLDLNRPEMKSSYVLLDAPCSGWGVLNRRADARWRRTETEINQLTKLQASLINHAADMVGEQGYLLYATCTINRAENEGIISDFLKHNEDFFLDDFSAKLSFFPLDKQDVIGASRGMLTLMPGKYGTDGMFYALLRRKQ